LAMGSRGRQRAADDNAQNDAHRPKRHRPNEPVENPYH
jgi:hypothetical protein